MVPVAYFGINSSTFSVAIDLLIVFLVVIWLALVYWTFADARRRIEDPLLIGCATAAALFPFVGSIVYMILRPPEYLEDVRERELEMQAAEARLSQLDYGLCPHCDYRIERDFLRCPSCLRKLKDRCGSCGRPLEQSWTICPYCEAEVASAAPARSRRRRARPQEQPTADAAPPGRSSRARRRPSERDSSLGLDGSLDADAPVATGLADEGSLNAADLLGETVESDSLLLSEDGEDGVAPVPASELASPAAPRARRRPSRPRPSS